jgi:hypothetical protein
MINAKCDFVKQKSDFLHYLRAQQEKNGHVKRIFPNDVSDAFWAN